MVQGARRQAKFTVGKHGEYDARIKAAQRRQQQLIELGVRHNPEDSDALTTPDIISMQEAAEIDHHYRAAFVISGPIDFNLHHTPMTIEHKNTRQPSKRPSHQ